MGVNRPDWRKFVRYPRKAEERDFSRDSSTLEGNIVMWPLARFISKEYFLRGDRDSAKRMCATAVEGAKEAYERHKFNVQRNLEKGKDPNNFLGMNFLDEMLYSGNIADLEEYGEAFAKDQLGSARFHDAAKAYRFVGKYKETRKMQRFKRAWKEYRKFIDTTTPFDWLRTNWGKDLELPSEEVRRELTEIVDSVMSIPGWENSCIFRSTIFDASVGAGDFERAYIFLGEQDFSELKVKYDLARRSGLEKEKSRIGKELSFRTLRPLLKTFSDKKVLSLEGRFLQSEEDLRDFIANFEKVKIDTQYFYPGKKKETISHGLSCSYVMVPNEDAILLENTKEALQKVKKYL